MGSSLSWGHGRPDRVAVLVDAAADLSDEVAGGRSYRSIGSG
jgi:hypothetical protein